MMNAVEEQAKFNQMLKDLALIAWPTPEDYAKNFPNKSDAHVSWIWEKSLGEQVREVLHKNLSEARLNYNL